MENAEAIADRQDKANYMQFGVIDETFTDIESKYEETYQEFKKVWIEHPALTKKEAFEKIGRTYNPDGFLAKHINKRLVEEGLPLNHKKEVNFEVKESSTKDDFEELYQRFKKIWLENPNISKKKAFKEMGEAQTNSRMKYINARMKEDGLSNHFNTSRLQEMPEEKKAEKIYQKYKELFETTDIPLKEVREQLHISDNTNNPLRKYIIERSKEDGLDGRRRNINQQRKKNPRVKKSKAKPKKKGRGRPRKIDISSTEKIERPEKKKDNRGVHNACNYSEHTLSCITNSEDTINKFFADRNIKRSTQKGYMASFHKWFQYHGTKYDSIQDCVNLYMDEEDKRIPMRDRTIKKELIGFRESLIEDTGIKSDKSVRSYFSKIGSLFRHYGLEIPDLPKVKLEKGYVSSYNDLPTHTMIKTACEQSPLDLKALILFMSSSGSAKAETLSITVEMFLTGCNEYLEEPANANNIQDTLKALSDKHDIVPLIYLRRIKTDKWYYTCCSPEASYMIIESLKTRKNLEWSDKLFDYTGSLILTKFQEINDNNNWGYVGAYRRFRSHALRKFMASNIGLPRDQVDSFQGRAKDMIQEAYFKQDPQSLKKIYLESMHRVMVYENWGHGTTLSEIEQRAKRLKNGFNDNEKILDLSVIPETPEEIKSSVGLESDVETTVGSDKNTRNVRQNSANTMPVTAPVQMPTGMVQGISISKELLQYAELMEKGLLSVGEFNRIKQTLLMSVIR